MDQGQITLPFVNCGIALAEIGGEMRQTRVLLSYARFRRCQFDLATFEAACSRVLGVSVCHRERTCRLELLIAARR